jgi:hypothetical protein
MPYRRRRQPPPTNLAFAAATGACLGERSA